MKATGTKVPASVLKDAEDAGNLLARTVKDYRADVASSTAKLDLLKKNLKATEDELAEMLSFLEGAGSTTKILEEIKAFVR